MDSTDYSNNATVARICVTSPGGHESKGLATVCASQSAASTSHSSALRTQDLRYLTWKKTLYVNPLQVETEKKYLFNECVLVRLCQDVLAIAPM